MDIKLLILDVDGTLTDGGIYYDDNGNETKKFSVKDGAGIVLGRSVGLKVMICTGRECPAVTKRANDLHIDYVFQNVKRKWEFIADFATQNGLMRSNLAYCGDDWNDLQGMKLCGWVACPANAAEEVKAIADYITPSKGGEGAVRDAIVHLLKENDLLETALENAFGVKED